MRPLIAGILAAAVALAGCGSSSGTTTTPSKATAENAQNAAQTKLNQCLAEHGVALDDASDRQNEKAQAALAGPCADEREGAFAELSENDQGAAQDARVKFRNCMAKQGIDMSDPAAVDQQDPLVKKASDGCRSLLPKSMQRAP